jgi:hypothetical protein
MMTELYGIELNVGEKPKPIYQSTVLDFNGIFLKMFKAFNESPKNRLVFASFHETGETGPFRSGDLSVRWVWQLLAHYQLIHVEKKKEPTGEVSEKTGNPKMRTLNIITPTKLGYDALEQGRLIEAELRWEQRTIEIGIGKSYGTFENEWAYLEALFKQVGIAKTRIEKWFYEFRKYYPELAEKEKGLCRLRVSQWGSEHIATAPKRRFQLKIKVEVAPSQRLERWFK